MLESGPSVGPKNLGGGGHKEIEGNLREKPLLPVLSKSGGGGCRGVTPPVCPPAPRFTGSVCC